MSDLSGRIVAVVGGSTAGAELAFRLADSGADVVVFEQNARPYGKIEDGLPRWHKAQRKKEYGVIDGKLAHERVHFVPKTRFGDDVDLEELEHRWGFHAVVLALGAWRDRPLPLDGASELVDRGLVYQNALIYWFNHKQEPDYQGRRYPTPDGALVIGGGLASIDVAKVFMLETVADKLRERGHEVDMVELEHKGIDKTLAAVDVNFADLGLQGATLCYRKRREDMPLVGMPPDADDKKREKVLASRVRVADKATAKYLFNIEALLSPESLIVEEGEVRGVRFHRMRHESDGRFSKTGEIVEKRAPLVVSSIGSIPEELPGVPMKGEFFDFEVLDAEREVVRLRGHPTVYAAGNTVTGKGNIVASRKHGAEIASEMKAWLLAGGTGPGVNPEHNEAQARATADTIASAIAAEAPLSADGREALMARVRERWQAVGYSGDYTAWIAAHAPA